MTIAIAPPPIATKACPKCGHANGIEAVDCARCQIVIDKWLKAGADAFEAEQAESIGWLGRLDGAESLSIRQDVERLEAWTGIETANSYVVRDGVGGLVSHVDEESGSFGDFFVRNWLKAARPFTMRVTDSNGETVLVLERPFRFYFSEVEVLDVLGKRVGLVQRQFSVFNSRYKLVGPRPSDTYEIHGPFLRPWTFKILRHGSECGLITKSWNGLRREMLTDADAFGIEFPAGISPELKSVFIGAVFLIDFAHFEDNTG